MSILYNTINTKCCLYKNILYINTLIKCFLYLRTERNTCMIFQSIKTEPRTEIRAAAQVCFEGLLNTLNRVTHSTQNQAKWLCCVSCKSGARYCYLPPGQTIFLLQSNSTQISSSLHRKKLTQFSWGLLSLSGTVHSTK